MYIKAVYEALQAMGFHFMGSVNASIASGINIYM
jgi:hypothetical protein